MYDSPLLGPAGSPSSMREAPPPDKPGDSKWLLVFGRDWEADKLGDSKRLLVFGRGWEAVEEAAEHSWFSSSST